MLLLIQPLLAAAQTNFITIITNGPAANRLNIVLFSEGYTTNQFGQFLVDATNAANNLLSYQPYQEYSNYFNVFAVSVPSKQSGCDCPSSAPTNTYDTFFNSTNEYPDYPPPMLITIPPNRADTNYAHGQGKIDSLLQAFLPGRSNLCILLVNSPLQGGSDGFDKTAIVASSSIAESTLVHETGHVVANLGDEYTNPYPNFPNTEEPNTTTNYANPKWKAWIPPGTPLPTPATATYMDTVGAFQGAHYHTSGWYRPQLNCLMGSTIQTFCKVCTEAMVLAFYRNVRPVDGFSPATTNLAFSPGQPLAFSLSLVQPLSHSLQVQWRTNGADVAGATNLSLTLPAEAVAGVANVQAVVSNSTPMVLATNDTKHLLVQTNTWRLPLRVNPPQLLSGGKLAFYVVGNLTQSVVLQGSTNLTTWSALSTNLLVTNTNAWWFTNSGLSAFPASFFRVKSPP